MDTLLSTRVPSRTLLAPSCCPSLSFRTSPEPSGSPPDLLRVLQPLSIHSRFFWPSSCSFLLSSTFFPDLFRAFQLSSGSLPGPSTSFRLLRIFSGLHSVPPHPFCSGPFILSLISSVILWIPPVLSSGLHLSSLDHLRSSPRTSSFITSPILCILRNTFCILRIPYATSMLSVP